ncbi:beta-lactamase family protein [Porticoccaceae bacterium]|nr:beta-lactamase family protein [Porticoccaceae bacterium]
MDNLLLKKIQNTLTTLVEGKYSGKENLKGIIYGAQLFITGLSNENNLTYVAGRLSAISCEPVTIENPIRIASNTKTYVAAVILRLYEEHQIDLDKSIKNYISTKSDQQLHSGNYDSKKITVRQLLAHTSGLFDYADSAAFQQQILEQPNKVWTREQQIQMAMEAGKPYGEPGEVYRYSDTGYILLGEIVELITQQTLAVAVRQLLRFNKIGLKHTWWEGQEPAPDNILPMCHQYMGDQDMTNNDPSFDTHGGGGLAATVEDMATFMRALFHHQVFNHKATLEIMLSKVPSMRGGPNAYRNTEQVPGSYHLGIETIANGVYGHAGFLGTRCVHMVDKDITFAFSVNQHRTDGRGKQLMLDMLSLLGGDI